MKTLSIISYFIGAVLLIISCFTTTPNTTWWLGGIAVVFLIAGCVCQFNTNPETHVYHNRNSNM